MKKRIRKKVSQCSHLYIGEDFQVTADPFPIYNYDYYCKLGKFNYTWGNRKYYDDPCLKCKCFTYSRNVARDDRERHDKAKKAFRLYQRIERRAKSLGISVKDYLMKFGR